MCGIVIIGAERDEVTGPSGRQRVSNATGRASARIIETPLDIPLYLG